MGNRFFHVFCDHGTSGNGCCCRQWNSEYFQKSCCMLLPRTWKCRQYHSGKPSWCRPSAGSEEVGETLTKTAIIAGIVSGLVLIALSPFITKCRSHPDSRGYLQKMLLICSYYIAGKSVNCMTIGGIFAAGGDSKFWNAV